MSKKSKSNKNNKKIQSIKNKLVNGELIKNEDALYINNPDYFLTFSDLEISDGIDIIENIMVLSDNYISFNRENEDDPLNDVELMEITEEYKENNDIENFIVVGCVTDICVSDFAKTLQCYIYENNLDKQVIVPINCVETYDYDHHNAELMNVFALYSMNLGGIKIVDEII